MLEFKCACACQLEPAERKGGDGGGRAPGGTKTVCGSVGPGKRMGIIIPAETFSTLAPSPLPSTPKIPQGFLLLGKLVGESGFGFVLFSAVFLASKPVWFIMPINKYSLNK